MSVRVKFIILSVLVIALVGLTAVAFASIQVGSFANFIDGISVAGLFGGPDAGTLGHCVSSGCTL